MCLRARLSEWPRGLAAEHGEADEHLPTAKPGLVLKELDTWRSIHSSALPLSWELLPNIARMASAHLFSDVGDMEWGNGSLLSLYLRSVGPRTVRFAEPTTVEDAYDGSVLAMNTASVDLPLARHETKLLLLRR